MALMKISLLLFLTICQIYDFAIGANNELSVINGVFCFSGSDNRPIDSYYRSNVYALLSILISKSSPSDSPPLEFYKTSVGEVSPRAYGSYLCRGDLNAEVCNKCLKMVEDYLIETNVLLGYNCVVHDSHLKCVVHYANNSKSLDFREDYTFTGGRFGDKALTKDSPYNTTLSNSIQDLIRDAQFGNWSKPNFATRVAKVPGSHEKIFILVQCTTDMPPLNCSKCLSDLGGSFAIGERESGHILGVNCLLKYDNHSFFGSAYRSFIPSYLHLILVFLLILYLSLF